MLDFSFWSIFWAVFNTVLLFVLLRIFLFKPLNKIKADRTRTIQDNLDSAEKAKTEAEELRQQYENSISDAKEEANQILIKAREDAEAERSAIIKKSQDEADKIIADADKTIENERKRVLRQAQSEIADLAIEAASKIIGENVDDEKNRRLVDKFLSEEEGKE
ncbi:F-type H+-transporting ATPase subunit b [Ruminococcus flavefaciens]|uniref:ATP synthase subunit b n=1 Tax=Ruminococcus flavefaciens TaxID=1265 RepID=A0A1H6J8C6_RUMFL|nr:F0F1 ATP synthase subunit B [Ruminococcus flavefaciens]SEH56961.1 F-type H+-transporting ATPase subunit b [Ruminococcus flavefaciens]